MKENIRVLLMLMPGSIRAFTVLKDGFYTIVINAILDRKQQLKEYNHEMNHILNGDFDSGLSADLIEMYSHEGTG